MGQIFGNVPWESIGLAAAVIAGALTLVLALLLLAECLFDWWKRWRRRR